MEVGHGWSPQLGVVAGRWVVDRRGDLFDGLLVAGHHQQREEAVHLPAVAIPVDGHSGLGQAVGICLPLVAQHVVLGGDDDRRWETSQISGLQWRRVGLAASLRVG